MQAPLFVRALTIEEQLQLETHLRSPAAFTVRRCQAVLASAEGQHIPVIARRLRGNEQTVRKALHAFNQQGMAALPPRSSRPHKTLALFDAQGQERVRALLQQSPRQFGKPTRLWTLRLVAEVSFALRLTPRQASEETIRATLVRLRVRWKRAQHWITSPDPGYARKKTS